MAKTKTIKVGETYPVPFKMHGDQVMTVNCVVLDTRQVYGRKEVKLVARDGDGAVWVTEATVRGESTSITLGRSS